MAGCPFKNQKPRQVSKTSKFTTTLASRTFSVTKTSRNSEFLEPISIYTQLSFQPMLERPISTRFGHSNLQYKSVSLSCTLNVYSQKMGTIKKHSIWGSRKVNEGRRHDRPCLGLPRHVYSVGFVGTPIAQT